MAGGNFTNQNKIRPGAYINFKAVSRTPDIGGTRGIVTVPLELPWGKTDKVISVRSIDFADGRTLETIGLTAQSNHESAFYLRQILQFAPTVLVYRTNNDSVYATVTIDNLVVTATHPGTLGNNLKIVITKENTKGYAVKIYLGASLRDTQLVSNATELQGNAWVTFDLIDEEKNDIKVTNGVNLEGGLDGLAKPSNYTEYFKKVSGHTFNVMALPATTRDVIRNGVETIKMMRDEKGKKSQIVVIDHPEANHEGVISVNQGFKTLTEELDVAAFSCYIAGLTASTAVNQSNTYRVVSNAVEIINEYTDTEIEEALQNGELVLSYRQDGAVVIEQDINTLVTLDETKNDSFRKNRVIRVLDDINNVVSQRFHQSYIGRVDNNADGRTLLKGDLVGYFNNLLAMGAIEDFGAEDIEILAGNDVNSVIVNLSVKPTDAMEKLYMTVTVN